MERSYYEVRYIYGPLIFACLALILLDSFGTALSSNQSAIRSLPAKSGALFGVDYTSLMKESRVIVIAKAFWSISQQMSPWGRQKKFRFLLPPDLPAQTRVSVPERPWNHCFCRRSLGLNLSEVKKPEQVHVKVRLILESTCSFHFDFALTGQ